LSVGWLPPGLCIRRAVIQHAERSRTRVRTLSKLRPLLVFGTRPEAIKMAPLVWACRRRADSVEPLVCLTGQHRELLAQVTDYFGIRADVHLDLMAADQTLAGLTARCVEGIDEVLLQTEPDCLVAQGDTTTVMAAALAAFYRRVPFVHVEAGLRTGNLSAPWPEEMNRRVASIVTALHCAPTQRAADALLAEGVRPETVHVTGNTVVDALLETLAREKANAAKWQRKYSLLGQARMILVTGHRRESFARRQGRQPNGVAAPLEEPAPVGRWDSCRENKLSQICDSEGLENICRAVATLARQFADCHLLWPVHLNPSVQEPVHRILSRQKNVHLVAPPAYPEFVWLMDRATLIMTDSGGVQEEAPSLGKPVLVMRQTSERPEAVEAGAAQLVGTSVETIVAAAARLLTNPDEYAARQIDHNPYGDGHAAERIVELMLQRQWTVDSCQ